MLSQPSVLLFSWLFHYSFFAALSSELRDHFALEQHVLRQTRHLHAGAGGIGLAEILGIDRVDGGEIVHVLDEYRCLDNTAHIGTGGFQQFGQVAEHPARRDRWRREPCWWKRLSCVLLLPFVWLYAYSSIIRGKLQSENERLSGFAQEADDSAVFPLSHIAPQLEIEYNAERMGEKGGSVISTWKILKRLVVIYTDHRLPRAAAALSYYMTMTFFPLIICLYSLLGKNYLRIMEALKFISQFISSDTTYMLRNFMGHVARSGSNAMLIAGLTVLLSSASAGVRSVQSTIGEMQGEEHYQGLAGFLFSLVFSVVFVAAIYFAILVLFTGRDFIEMLNGWLPFIDIGGSWQWIRFLLLAGIIFVIDWAVYAVSKRRTDRYRTFPGAVFTTVGMVVMSYVFSAFITASARYSLVYGSLASLILLMFWLYLCCQIIYLGAALNIAIRDVCGEPGSKE